MNSGAMILIRPRLGDGLSNVFILLSNTVPSTTELHESSASDLGLAASLGMIRKRSLQSQDSRRGKREAIHWYVNGKNY